MPSFEIKLDSRPIAAAADALAVAGKGLPNAQALVLNRVVTRTRPKVVAAVVRKTGLYPKIISKAVRPLRASPRNLRAGLVARGGEISLRFFKAREEGGGVVADVAGEREFFAGGFRRSGQIGRRYMVKRLNQQVYVRDTDSRKWGALPIEKQRSGVYIPLKMIEGEAREAFETVAMTELPNEVAKELAKILGRAAR